jgi:hypothetical protein
VSIRCVTETTDSEEKNHTGCVTGDPPYIRKPPNRLSVLLQRPPQPSTNQPQLQAAPARRRVAKLAARRVHAAPTAVLAMNCVRKIGSSEECLRVLKVTGRRAQKLSVLQQSDLITRENDTSFLGGFLFESIGGRCLNPPPWIISFQLMTTAHAS